MTFPLTRRRSVAVAAPRAGDNHETRENGDNHLVRRASFPYAPPHPENAPPPPSKGVFSSLFRRGSDTSRNNERLTGVKTTTAPGRSSQTIKHEHLNKEADPLVHGHDGRLRRASEEKEPPGATSENHRPYTVQDALELRIDAGLQANERALEAQGNPILPDERTLTRDDVKALFSGAPHFLLERGKQNVFYPQVIFPWDEHDTSIQNLWDRKALAHRSFALSTVHPHLPIPEEWMVNHRSSSPDHDLDAHSSKRAVFDIGVFEVPSMLSMNGWEPGSVGYRYYLEFPTADSVKYAGPPRIKMGPELQEFSSLPATSVFEMMEHHDEPYSECGNHRIHERHSLLYEGPLAWKRIGVRDTDFKVMIDRLERLRNIRHECLHHGPGVKTILDFESSHDLYNVLFTKFLHPPPQKLVNTYYENPHSLKAQIKVLTHVLAVQGAWWDFSLVEWRFRVGQILWEAPPHPDGDFFDLDSCPDPAKRPWIKPRLERKWLLLQMLLAAELLLRLDAAAQVRGPDHFILIESELRIFNKLRSGKVNWDLVVVRRFLDSFNIGCAPAKVNPEPPTEKSENALERHLSLGKGHRFFGLGRRMSTSGVTSTWFAWECKLASSHTGRQLEGLLTFAENIGWPRFEAFKTRMQSVVMNGVSAPVVDDIFARSVLNILPGSSIPKPVKDEMYRKSSSRWPVYLHCARSKGDTTIGGWLSRSWLSGFVLPGESSNHLLMAALLENDPPAVERLGPAANLYGGFLLDGKTWWSKACLVGRVLASLDGVKECMGWMSCNVVPRHATTSNPFDDTWFEVITTPTPRWSEKARIEQGSKVIRESTPLGVGVLSGETFVLPMDEPLTPVSEDKVDFEDLILYTEAVDESLPLHHIRIAKEAILSFNIRSALAAMPAKILLPLTYNVHFISAHECRAPLGRVSGHQGSESDFIGFKMAHSSVLALPSGHTRLPGHPLHTSYSYKYIPLSSLPELPTAKVLFSQKDGDEKRDEITVVDARGCKNKETFARAWCASVGTDAVIGRVGRTCLSCCIREAYAADVGLVIRVGE